MEMRLELIQRTAQKWGLSIDSNINMHYTNTGYSHEFLFPQYKAGAFAYNFEVQLVLCEKSRFHWHPVQLMNVNLVGYALKQLYLISWVYMLYTYIYMYMN